MKKILFAAYILACTACKKSDNNAQVIGNWTLATETDYTYTNGTQTGSQVLNIGTLLVLNSDGTGYTTNSAGGKTNITWGSSGGQLNISFPAGVTSHQTIKTLTSHQMITDRGSIASGEVMEDTFTR